MTEPQIAPVDVETAVRTAKLALPKFLGGATPQLLRVEEVVPDHEHGEWRITLSYLEEGVRVPENKYAQMVRNSVDGSAPLPPTERVLRVVKVNATTGEPVGMLIRTNGQ
jgi:hypothetical protein